MIKDKFNMTREENVYLAKRLMVDSIWKTANLEGIAVTFPDTQTIFDGYTVSGYTVNELVSVNNLKRAWFFILDNLDYRMDLNYISKVNRIVGGDQVVYQAGNLRNFDVAIGGTSWRPEIPCENEIKSELDVLMQNSNSTERAISLMLYIMRSQIFADGNKRTAQICANQVMIQNNVGIISIPIKEQSIFTKLLIDYYESNNDETIKKFVYDKCIEGITAHKSNDKDLSL